MLCDKEAGEVGKEIVAVQEVEETDSGENGKEEVGKTQVIDVGSGQKPQGMKGWRRHERGGGDGSGKCAKQKYGGIYGEGAKKRYRGVDESFDIEVEEVTKKPTIGGAFLVGDKFPIAVEVGIDQPRRSP